jgi:hypothetical protein
MEQLLLVVAGEDEKPRRRRRGGGGGVHAVEVVAGERGEALALAIYVYMASETRSAWVDGGERESRGLKHDRDTYRMDAQPCLSLILGSTAQQHRPWKFCFDLNI